MNLGEIYYWVTDQATGYATRPKYHVYLCEANWETEGDHAFLFINKSNYSGDCYAINNSDYAFLPLDVSYISGSIVAYSNEALVASKPQHCGALSKGHLIELRSCIAGSDTMEQWQINLACAALQAAHEMK